MGARANYVIIRGGKVSAYYDHWGAGEALLAALDGPAECEDAAEGLGQVDELMDWGFCEGGYLVDFDKKVALFFGFVDPQYAPSLEPESDEVMLGFDVLVLKRAADKWPGWRLSYAHNGVDDFSAYLEKKPLAGQIKTQPRRPPEPAPANGPRRPPPPPQPPRRLNKKKKR